MEREVKNKENELIKALKNNQNLNEEAYYRMKQNVNLINEYGSKQSHSVIECHYQEGVKGVVGEAYIGNNMKEHIPYRIKVDDRYCVECLGGFIEFNYRTFYPIEIEILNIIDHRNIKKFRSLLVSDFLVEKYGADLLKNYYISSTGELIKIKRNKSSVVIKNISQCKKYKDVSNSRMYVNLSENKSTAQITVAKIIANVYDQALSNNINYQSNELHTHHIDGNRINDTVGNVIIIPAEYHRTIEASFHNFNVRTKENYSEDVQKLLKVLRIHLIDKQPLY